MNIVQYLSKSLLLSESDIALFVKKSPYKYKVYSIPKRSGRGQRIIAQPSSELKIVQRMVLDKFLKGLPVHPCAMAYRDGVGIKQNASAHVSNSYLLKMDFSDFFPSIKSQDLLMHVQQHLGEIAGLDKICLQKIFFWMKRGDPVPKLSIGAPSSPFLSNTIMYEFDCLLHDWCSKNQITYTRYADDLTLTTNVKDILREAPKVVFQILKSLDYPRLSVNHEKTVFSSKKHNRHVTGLVLTNDGKVSLGRDKKREIKTLVFLFGQNKLSPEGISYLNGYISHIKNVEPGFYCSLVKKFGVSVLGALK